ncbi:methyl-accepting chemotaxis protein [Pseudazoarcus pumilus]|uniref:Chemotaxis protein n=1 Tax=Pseudazoarcus pumilus TaxID=2067960 RepID=A0A2I6S6Z2_9RHOO|nr:methyl-accepting chemotaxis protein [Pseudazoarcus pumilus]AUN95001.1 chemotaxis protein [Pseudazoarcus pumilus]
MKKNAANRSPSTIGQRLTLLVAIPLAALIVFAGLGIHAGWQKYRSAAITQELMSISVAANDLIHRMQVERGASGVFLSSGGQRFADPLPGYRAETGTALQALQARIDATGSASLPDVAVVLDAARERLDGLAATRAAIDAQEMDAGTSGAWYTGTIDRLIDGMAAVARYNEDPTIAQRASAFESLVRAKESAGLERALNAQVFAANFSTPEQYERLIRLVNRQEAFFEMFHTAAGEALAGALDTLRDSEAEREVLRLRGIIEEQQMLGGFDVAPADWFAASTRRIEGLRVIEQQLAGEIDAASGALVDAGQRALALTLAAALLAVLFTVAVSTWVARSIARPLKAAIEVAEHVSREDDFTHKVPEEGVAEVMRAAQAFNALMDKFRLILGETGQSSHAIASAAQSLSASSAELSRGADLQSDAASSMAAGVEQASVSISETASNADSAAELVNNARERTQSALRLMKEMVDRVRHIASRINASSRDVLELESGSQKIGGIVAVIREIAEQTNLLALNAAIEAARAGEQGRGFAVVADEVRKLAERTSSATGEIGAIIEEIQGRVGGTVTAMQETDADADSSLELVTRTAGALEEIGDSSAHVADNVQAIADALREQNAAVQQVAVNVERIADMSGQNSASAQSNAATAAQMEEQVARLDALISRFRLQAA